MAEEEVDWGMDETVDDVWRQGGNVTVGDNEDEISLDGLEGDELKPNSAKASATARQPPTGPRKASFNGGGAYPTGPRGQADDRRQPRAQRGGESRAQESGGRVRNDARGANGPIQAAGNPTRTEEASNGQAQSQQEAEGATVDEEPLPEGWASVVSRSQGAIFYHNKTTGETSWTRPRVIPEVVEEVVAEAPPTPPQVIAGSVSVENAAASAVPAEVPAEVPASAVKRERAPPTGPGGGRYADLSRPAAPPSSVSGVDPVQSAYASRRAATASREYRPADDRGIKRASSPRRDEAKRSRMEDGRPEPSRPDRDYAPSGPRAYAPDARAASPQRLLADGNRPGNSFRHDVSAEVAHAGMCAAKGQRSSSAAQEARSSRRPPAMHGSNTEPLAVNKWAAKAASASGDAAIPPLAPSPVREVIEAPTTHATALEPVPSIPTRGGASEDAAARRALLREEARKAEETLRRVREEEERLEREEVEELSRQEADAGRRREDEERSRDEARSREEDSRRQRDEDRRPRGGNSRRQPSPTRLQQADRSYRPSSFSPPHVPQGSRLDGSNPQAPLRDTRRRPQSPNRISRRTSPAPYSAERGPPGRSGRDQRYDPRSPSPPRRNGDSYYPELSGRDDRDRVDRRPLVDRIGRQRAPETFAEPLRGPRPRSPPPRNDFRRDPPASSLQARPLAERMSRDSPSARDGGRGGPGGFARRMGDR